MGKPLCVAFDCDGVLADSISSWKTIHDHFGTDSTDLLKQFMAGELTDTEFMAADIAMWKEKSPKIHRDDLFRAYSGCKLMKGAKELVADLKAAGIHVAIVSAGVDLYVQSIAALVKADDWIANGFEWDDGGWLIGGLPTRVLSHEKGLMVEKLARINGFGTEEIVCVGDSSTDLSMIVGESGFIGFNPARKRAVAAFEEAGVPIVQGKDLRKIWPYIYPEEDHVPRRSG